MKSAQELRERKQSKLQERLKETTERINMELVEIEKAQNKWESDLDDNKPYFEIPILIKTKEVKDLLHEQGYIIDRVSNDIKVNTTRIYVNEQEYNAVLKLNHMINKTKESPINKIKIEQTKDSHESTLEEYLKSIGCIRIK